MRAPAWQSGVPKTFGGIGSTCPRARGRHQFLACINSTRAARVWGFETIKSTWCPNVSVNNDPP
eukprot:11227349-Lingulodinium_polyedra.AAC.1